MNVNKNIKWNLIDYTHTPTIVFIYNACSISIIIITYYK